MKRRNGYKEDFDLGQGVLASAIFATIILVVVLVGIVVIFGFDKLFEGSNELAERFNALSRPERVLLAEWNDYEVDESYLMPITDKTVKFKDYIAIFAERDVQIGFLTIVSLLTFWLYSDTRKKENFFLADLPERGIRGIILLILFWAGCPFLLGSLVQMKRWEAQQKAESTEAEVPSESQDETTVDSDNEENGDVTYEDRSIDRTRFAKEAYEQFVEFCQSEPQLIHRHRVAKAEETTADCETKLLRLKREVQDAEQEMEKAQGFLQDVKVETVPEKTLDDIKQDWETIKNLHGVVAIYEKGCGSLCIDIEVRTSYDDKVYDIGDFTITVFDGYIMRECTRSGLKADWDGAYAGVDAFYLSSEKHCGAYRFRKGEKLLRAYHICDAIMMAINSLYIDSHASDSWEMLQHFRRVVPPKVEQKFDN